MKIMNGFYSPSRGKMEFMGEPVDFASPRDARNAGIETVYQDLALIPALSIWRNFFLGRELKVGRWPLRFLRQEAHAANHDGKSSRNGPYQAPLTG